MAPLAHKAYRRPVQTRKSTILVVSRRKANDRGFTPDQAVQFAIPGDAGFAEFLFRVERDPKGKFGPITDLELASRLSYFLWSSTPDEELLPLLRRDRLRKPGVLDRQITRMLADPKSLALAENFAGQWLETRGLAAEKPDSGEVPDVERGSFRKTWRRRLACSSTRFCARTGPFPSS